VAEREDLVLRKIAELNQGPIKQEALQDLSRNHVGGHRLETL